MRLAFLALAVGMLLCAAMPAVAAPGDDIGATVRIVNLVTGAYAEDKRNLDTGDSVRQDELIEVSDDGIGEIRLRDDTELALGPGARLLLDEFVYNPDIAGGAIVLNLVRGAFRFVTGIAAKPAYVIRTPTAAITVRGTIFDMYIEDSGISWLLLLEGGIEACSEQGQCTELDEPGKLVRITPDGFVSEPLIWADLPTGDLPFETAFPFIVTPPQIDPDPIFTPDEIVDGSIPDGPIYDNDDDDDDIIEIDDSSPEAPDTGPPLYCWSGWKKVPRGWSEQGWRVKHRRRGDYVIRCAHPIVEPPPDIIYPPKPECYGGRIVLLKTLPPRWRCICPDGKKRHRLGPSTFVCKGKPGRDPEKECRRKGWFWIGGVCLPKIGQCPKGTKGKWPDCKEIGPPKCPWGYVGKPPHCKPKSCPRGKVGKWPNCKDIDNPPKKCPWGYVGTRPNCEPRTCPRGKFGKWPNCKDIDGPPKKCPNGFYGRPPNCKPKTCGRGKVGTWPNCKNIEDPKKCASGFFGKWPNCKKIEEPPKRCPSGKIGKWPNCKTIVKPPKKCGRGTFGTWPNCKKVDKPRPQKCPKGKVGKWPNCKSINKPKPKKCGRGTFGKWPNCKKVNRPKKPPPNKGPPKKRPQKKSNKKCPKGTVGKYPNCIKFGQF